MADGPGVSSGPSHHLRGKPAWRTFQAHQLDHKAQCKNSLLVWALESEEGRLASVSTLCAGATSVSERDRGSSQRRRCVTALTVLAEQ